MGIHKHRANLDTRSHLLLVVILLFDWACGYSITSNRPKKLDAHAVAERIDEYYRKSGSLAISFEQSHLDGGKASHKGSGRLLVKDRKLRLDDLSEPLRRVPEVVRMATIRDGDLYIVDFVARSQSHRVQPPPIALLFPRPLELFRAAASVRAEKTTSGDISVTLTISGATLTLTVSAEDYHVKEVQVGSERLTLSYVDSVVPLGNDLFEIPMNVPGYSDDNTSVLAFPLFPLMPN